MSIFAEYKRGIISADEFRAAAAREFAGDNEPDYYEEEEPEPIKEKAAPINWHPDDQPPCGGEFFVTLAYDFEAGGKRWRGRYNDFAEYDWKPQKWIFENPDAYLLKKGAHVIAWAVLPDPYDGEIKEANNA